MIFTNMKWRIFAKFFCSAAVLFLCSATVFAQEGVTVRNGRLVFPTLASLKSTITNLENQVDSYVDTRPDFVEGVPFDPDPVLGAFETNLGFRSLRKVSLDNEFSQLSAGADPEFMTSYSWLGDDVLESILNENYVFQIADTIFIHKQYGYIKVLHANEAVLAAILTGENPGKYPHDVEIVGDDRGMSSSCLADFTYSASYASSNTGSFTFSGAVDAAGATFHYDFGDGTSSELKNPTKQYANSGDYNVCLTITSDSSCTDQICKLIEVNQGCIALFKCDASGTPGLVSFTNNSYTQYGSITGYLWTFGDGTPPVNTMNTTHQFTCNGDWIVTLKITTSTGCTNTFTKKVRVNSFKCCDDQIKMLETDKTIKFADNKRKIKVEAWDVQFLGWNNVNSKIRHYKKAVLWWPKKADLRTDIIGNVYVKNAKGCTCELQYPINGSKSEHTWRIKFKRQVGQRFKTKEDDRWKAKFWVDGNFMWEIIPKITCDQDNCSLF